MDKRNTTPVPNAILDEHLPHLKPVELKVLLVVIRQTLGWNKEVDWISMSQFIRKTGASKRALHQALGSLAEAGFIRVESYRGRRHYALKQAKKSNQGVAKPAPRPVQNLPPTKDTLTKNTCTRDKNCPPEKLRAIRLELVAKGILPPSHA